jgi:glucan biosynthesis protein
VELSYRLGWSMEEPRDAMLARVAATREESHRDHRVTYAIDFTDPRAKQRDAAALNVDATASNNAKIISRRLQPHPHGWRVTLEVESTSPATPTQLDCRLRDRSNPISETWRYRFED